MTIIPLSYNSQFWREIYLAVWRKFISHLQLNSGDSKSDTEESPTYSKYRVYSSIKPIPRRPQLQPTQQQPKPNFVTPCATHIVQTPPPTTVTTSTDAASTDVAAFVSHAPHPTAQLTQQFK
ncbi:hypothetical protein Fot_02886 [Forsythia ovata]|uniref:Uncharacterized protein n=1 Tax=Forsythia ovata TaxID=205694 RepID=A0ABD1X845_9LAMI